MRPSRQAGRALGIPAVVLLCMGCTFYANPEVPAKKTIPNIEMKHRSANLGEIEIYYASHHGSFRGNPDIWNDYLVEQVKARVLRAGIRPKSATEVFIDISNLRGRSGGATAGFFAKATVTIPARSYKKDFEGEHEGVFWSDRDCGIVAEQLLDNLADQIIMDPDFRASLEQ